MSATSARHEARLKQAGLRRFTAQEEYFHSTRLLQAAVRTAAKNGMTKTRIAEVAGVSRQTVHEILRD